MATSIANPSLTNLQVNTWTNVYNSAPVAGFTDTVRIVVEVDSGTIRLATSVPGITPATGYSNLYDGKATSIAFEGTQAQVNAALQSLQAYNTNADASPTLKISAVLGGAAYNPANGHYYKVVTSGSLIEWTTAKNDAASESNKFNGLTGYLATITSATEDQFIKEKISANAWIGASDDASEGNWRWVTGPEGLENSGTGRPFWTGLSGGSRVDGSYTNWASGEPNNGNLGDQEGDQDWAQVYATGLWDDNFLTNNVYSYIVEYGGIGNPDQAPAVSTTTLTVIAPPVITSNGSDTTATVNYAENSTTPVTIVTADDDDSGDSKTFSISGTDADKFQIDASGKLTFKASPNYEAPTDSDSNNSYLVTVRVTDSTGLYDEQALTVNVTNVNDLPATSGSLPASITTTEDATVDVNLSALSFSDQDPSDTFILKLAASKGTLAATGADGVTVVGSGSNTLTLTGTPDAVTTFLDTASNIRYTGALNDNGSPAATIAVSYKDSVMSSFTDYGSAVPVNIAAVNDAPTSTDKTVTFSEDGSHTFGIADFVFADAADTVSGGSTANTLQAVKITALPTLGSLTLNGAAVNAGDLVTVANITGGKLKFEPVADANGTGYTSFTFQVRDDGGTDNGGVDLDPEANTITLNVTPVNDAPVLVNADTSAPTLTTIDENATDSAGNLISTLVRAVDGTTDATGVTDKSFVTDVDFATRGTGEGYDGGVAIYGLSNDGPADGGTWQYKIGNGTWTDVGTVSAASALLLASTDSIRFVPDEKNATTATFSYYIWDGSAGTAGHKVNVSETKTTAFSTAGDVATITVTHVNDAPTLDLDANDSSTTGTGFTTVFRPLGQSVALVDTDVLIGDVDKLDRDGTQPDTLTSAKVFIASGALNNLGTTKYETLSSTAGSSFTATSGAVITISGNGISSASPLTLTGAGTWVDYQEALQTLRYQNTSDSAVAGNRNISITVTDAAITTGNEADRLESAVATSVVQVIWAPVQDLNGGEDGRGYTTTYVEDTAGIPIAAENAVINSGEKVKSLVATLTNPLDGTNGDAESLFIDGETVTTLQGVGFTITGNGTHKLTLTGNLDKSLYGLALQAIQYKNTSQDPGTTPRTVEVTVTDVNNQTGAPVVSTVNITPVNDAPSDIALSASTIALTATGIQDGTATAAVEVATITVTDVDNSTHTLSVGGDDAALFEVVNGKLYLKAGTTLDATAKSSYAVSVTANDGSASNNTLTEDFTIQVTEAVAPVFSIAAVSGTTLTLYYKDSSRLDPSKVPDKSAFTVTASPAVAVSAVSIPNDTSKTVVLTLNAAPTGTVTVGYTAPETNPVQDTSGNKAASLTSGAVTTATVTTGPTLTITTSNGGTVPAPLGDFTLVNNSTDPVTVTGATDGQAVTVSGTGNTNVQSPAGDLTVDNNGTGTVTVNGLSAGKKLTVKGSGPTSISNPNGSLSVDNTGTGQVTVTGNLAGDTLTIDGTGTGPVAINNTGSTAVIVASVNDGQAITASGTGPTTINDPDGNLSVGNTGTGLVTVSGDLAGDTLTIDGTGTGPVAINNTGSTAVTVASVNNGQTITASGTGPTTISNPDGSLSMGNTGTGLVTVTGDLAGDTLTIDGTGTGPVAINNTGSTAVIVASVNDGQAITASGTGPTTINDPDGNLSVGNTGTGLVTVSGDLAGDTLTIDGTGTGPVAINNTGSTAVTVASVNDGQTITASGTGPTTISNPDGSLSMGNTGTGLVTVTGDLAGDTLTIDGTGTGPVAINNTGSTAVIVASVNDGQAITASGTGPTTINDPDGNLSVGNTGTGLVTVSGDLAGDTLTIDGTGTGPVAINNTGSTAVTVASVNDGQTITASGTGPTQITAPDGDLTIANSGTGTVTVEGLINGKTLNTTGTQPITVDLSHLTSDQTITIDNDGSGVVNLVNVPDGVSVLTTGSGSGGINYVPTLSGVPGTTQGVTAGSAAALADFTVADRDTSNTLTVTLTATNGTIGGLTDADTNTAGIQLTGTADAINTALAAATFTAASAGAASISVSVTDGKVSSPTTATYSLNATSAPSSGGAPAPAPTPTPTPEGAIQNGVSNTTVTTDGGAQTTTTGTIGTVPVVETVTVTADGNTVRELVYVPTTTGTGAGSSTPTVLPLLYETVAGSTSNTTVSLPSGVGLVSVGDRTPTTTTGQQGLITLIQSTVSDGDPSRTDMLGGGQSFLEALPEDATLWVNKIQLTAPTALPNAPSVPVVVSGAARTEASTSTADKLEALVIDATALPQGTVIELHDIDFAVVVGNGVFVRGGSGANVVYGGAGSQYILLGEADDVLYGGADDDTVGSEGGNDRIFGNAGNDTLFGGEGEDLLHGGADTDVATFTGSISRYEIVRDHGKTIVRALDRADDVDTVINVETLRFDDADYTVENAPQYTVIASLYGEVLDRQADLAGFQYWAERYAAGESMGDIALSFLYSAEYQSGSGLQFSTLSTAAQLDLFYLHFLGRTPDEAGHAYWMNRIEDGMSLNDVAHSFVVSTEMQGVYAQPTAWEFLL